MTRSFSGMITNLFLAVVFTAISISAASGTTGKGKIPMKEGKWNLVAEMQMSGFPGMGSLPPRTVEITECLTAHQPVPQNTRKDCTFLSNRIDGDTLKFSMRCPTGKTTGTFTYHQTSMHGFLTVLLNRPPGARLEERIRGHYVSPCSPS